MTSRDDYYALAARLEQEVTGILLDESVGQLFIAGTAELAEGFLERCSAAFSEGGFEISLVKGLDLLPQDLAFDDLLIYLAPNSLREALADLGRLSSTVRSILVLEEPLLFTTDLPLLCRAGVMDLLGHDCDGRQVLRSLRRIADSPLPPVTLIERMARRIEALEDVSCISSFDEPARSRVRVRIATLKSLLAAARCWYFAPY